MVQCLSFTLFFPFRYISESLVFIFCGVGLLVMAPYVIVAYLYTAWAVCVGTSKWNSKRGCHLNLSKSGIFVFKYGFISFQTFSKFATSWFTIQEIKSFSNVTSSITLPTVWNQSFSAWVRLFQSWIMSAYRMFRSFWSIFIFGLFNIYILKDSYPFVYSFSMLRFRLSDGCERWILVSHGDTLQIALTHFSGVSAHMHRHQPHLHNCEVRLLQRISPTSHVWYCEVWCFKHG